MVTTQTPSRPAATLGAATPARPGGTRGTRCLGRHVYWRRRHPLLAMLVALLRDDFGNALGSRRNQRMPRRVP
jgi:hypothetical protein